MLERSSYTGDMNKLSTAKRCQVLSAIVEGCAVNATARMTGVSVPTILKLVLDAGDACAEAHHETVRAVKAKRVQADEMWSFVGKKERNATEADKACGMGDAWVWMALCADSKLIVSYLVGPRTAESAAEFMLDLASRLASRVQLSTDGLRVYVDAVEEAFGADIDYAQLVKQYSSTIEGQRRYSPAECCGALKTPVTGSPDDAHINTSFIERANLTVRMNDRRFTRLTNAFSKKLQNHVASVHLHNFWYNFGKSHRSLPGKITPAMAAGIASRFWTMEDVVALIDKREVEAAKAAASAKSAKPSGLVPVRRSAQIG